MKELVLRNYGSTKEFIEAVENADTWDAIPTEDYEEALEKAGLNYHDYDDPDEMWDDFMKSVKNRRKRNMKLNQIEYRKIIERLAPETSNATYDYEFDGLSNIFDDMSYHEHIALIEKLLSTNLTKEDRALLSEWHQRYIDLNDKFIFDSVMRKIGKAFNMREICDMARVPYQSYRNYKSTGKGLSHENMRKLTAKMGGISRYVNDIVKANK